MTPLAPDPFLPPPGWLRGMVLASLLFQGALLALRPVPSPVSLGRELRSRGWPSVLRRAPAALAAAGILGAAAGALHPPLGACLFPIPLPGGVGGVRDAAAALAILAGHGLIVAAVRTLRRETAFNGDGQSRELVTGGVFGRLRHPIAAGLVCLYLGCVLAAPNALGLAGLMAFGGHLHRQIGREERLLEARFGAPYRAYRRAVGAVWPRRRKPG